MQNSTIYHIEHIVYFMNYICEYYRKHFDRHDYIGRVWNEFKSLYIFYYVIITYKFYIEFVYWIFVQYILQMWENFTTTFVTFTSTSLLVAFYVTQRLCLFYPRNPRGKKHLRIFEFLQFRELDFPIPVASLSYFIDVIFIWKWQMIYL